jgi:hypothetical protein
MAMPHLGAFVPSRYFAIIYVPVYSSGNRALDWIRVAGAMGVEGARAETLEKAGRSPRNEQPA